MVAVCLVMCVVLTWTEMIVLVSFNYRLLGQWVPLKPASEIEPPTGCAVGSGGAQDQRYLPPKPNEMADAHRDGSDLLAQIEIRKLLSQFGKARVVWGVGVRRRTRTGRNDR